MALPLSIISSGTARCGTMRKGTSHQTRVFPSLAGKHGHIAVVTPIHSNIRNENTAGLLQQTRSRRSSADTRSTPRTESPLPEPAHKLLDSVPGTHNPSSLFSDENSIVVKSEMAHLRVGGSFHRAGGKILAIKFCQTVGSVTDTRKVERVGGDTCSTILVHCVSNASY